MSKVFDVRDDARDESTRVPRVDGKRYLHVYKSRRDASGQRLICEWGELVDRLKAPVVTPETHAEFINMDKEQQGKLKDVGGYIAAHVDGPRTAAGVKSRWLVALDVDEGDETTLGRVQNALGGVKHLIHSTRRSTTGAPRYRVLIPLQQCLPPKQFTEASLYCAELLKSAGVHGVDDGSHQPARLMFFPSISSDQGYHFEVHDGVEMDGHAVSCVQIEKRTFVDPRGKAGYVGAFCTAYNVHEAIEKFCSDKYIRRSQQRYEYSGSSSGIAGVYVFDDALAAYSHHDSDELKGKASNAYDIVLQHGFDGDKAAFHAVLQDDELVMGGFRHEAVEVVKDDKWMQTLKRDEDGKLVKSIDNITKILLNDVDVCDGIRYNELNESIDIVGALPWKKTSGRWGDDDHLCLIGWMERKYGIYNKEKLDVSLAEYLKQRRFDPLKQYLDECHDAWDKVPRAEKLIIRYLGAEDTPYTRACTRVMLLGAVSRAYEAGCKFDYVVCLLSKQGAGKSTLLNKLGGKWYSDSITTMEGIEAYEALRGVWIVEVAELAAKRKSGRDAVKKFLTSQVDTYRPKYGRNVRQFFRRNIFVATTNDAEMLNDPTGNRRFLPISCNGDGDKSVHDLTIDDVKHIWGEVVGWYKAGHRGVLDAATERIADDVRQEHTELGMITETILTFLEKPISSNWYNMSVFDRRSKMQSPDGMCTHPRDFISQREIWKECLNGEGETPSYDVRREIANAMSYLRAKGWTRHKKRLGRDYGDSPVTGLRRP